MGIKESDEFAELQEFYRDIRDYVLKGGIKTYVLGTKNELAKLPAGRYWTLFDGAIAALEFASLYYSGNVPDIKSLIEIDLTLRAVRTFIGENEHRIGPGLPGSAREFFGYLLENRNRRK